jgi:AraC-like DNA-binding protein
MPSRKTFPVDRCWAWSSAALSGVECFRARGLTRTYARHTHEAFAIGVIEHGIGVSRYRGANFRFPTGHIVAMNPDEPHTGGADGQRGLTYRMVYVRPDAFAALGPAGIAPDFRGPCIRDRELAARLLAAHAALEREDGLPGDAMLGLALTDLAVRYGRVRAPAAPAREPGAVARAKEILRAGYQQRVTLRALADEAGISAAHLVRAFQRSTGVPPHAWLLQVRVAAGKERLARGEPIVGVAADLGFADQSHFTRCFRRLTGMTPGQYAAGRGPRRR